jgi:hypothetical protein
MEGFVKSEVPALEDEVGREGSAMGHLINASNYWYKRAERSEAALQRVRVQAAARATSFLVVFAFGVVTGGLLHWFGVW